MTDFLLQTENNNYSDDLLLNERDWHPERGWYLEESWYTFYRRDKR